MPLQVSDDPDISTLYAAIQRYDFPCVVYDFQENSERSFDSILGVEATIRSQLLSNDLPCVKDGLSNILYWGFARARYRWYRVNRFRANVRLERLERAQELFQSVDGSALIQIRDLQLPEFSGMSFISKLRMFLDPSMYVVFDLKLLSLRNQLAPTIFRDINAPTDATTIIVTQHNESVYERWCQQCRVMATRWYPNSGLRAVDIERGIFQLIGEGQAAVAASIISKP